MFLIVWLWTFPPQNTLTPLARLRQYIVRLLGSLGGQTNLLLLGSREIDPSRIVAWDTEKHLSFAVPFQDMKPNIYLGKTKYKVLYIQFISQLQFQARLITFEQVFMYIELKVHV